MNETLLYTLPQWFVFSGLFVIVYGWVEKKKAFRMIGLGILLCLGIFSIFTLTGDSLAAGKVFTPEEIMQEELEGEITTDLPLAAKLLPAYWSFVVGMLFALPGIILDLKNSSRYKWFTALAVLCALSGFFQIVSAIKSL